MRILMDLRPDTIVVYEVEDEWLIQKKDVVLSDKVKILKFMKKSMYLAILLDNTHCVFGEKRIEHMKTLLTDGNWLWSADINHYVEEHNFQLPNFFREYLKSIDYKFKKSDDFDDEIINSILDRIYDSKGYLNLSKMNVQKLRNEDFV